MSGPKKSQPRHGEPLPLGSGELPYSKGLMARALIAAGVPADRAYQLARRLELDLAERGASSVQVERLEALAREILGPEEGERATGRLRRLADLQTLDIPIIVLIGGSTGTGKSTVAAEVAHRLGITRVASTDFIRQTMRAFFSREFMPTIHYSSFEAGEALDDEVTGDPAIVGFVDQCRHVCVGVDAAIRRSLTEGWSMVLEGVHLVPGLLPSELEGALLVHVVVEIADADVHRMHFHTRDSATGGIRAMDKYLERLDDIRRVQTYIVGRARRESVPVVENANVERTIDRVIELVMQAFERSRSA
jgi:2-phosphoglycerate kinase